jgi:predicted aminopeptidase
VTRVNILLSAVLLLLLQGCSNVGYYMQSVGGQIEVWRRERPIEKVIQDPATSVELRRKLERVLEIREFASRELHLPDNRSYRRYADLERQYVVWNVFAAPEFSVRPLQWCFLFAGCVSYRGYFANHDAERFAAGLAAQGHDVFVRGVPAYSALGWFPDPVLSTFIHYSGPELARLVFHELAHQVVYVRDDSVFNESFAVAVDTEGVRRWLERTSDQRALAEFERAQQRRREFAGLIEAHRRKLDALYRSGLPAERMREGKAAILRELHEAYEQLKADWGGFAGYDPWFARKPNNAQIASVSIYTQKVPAFEALLRQEGGDLRRFYEAVKKLAALPREERTARLREIEASMR